LDGNAALMSDAGAVPAETSLKCCKCKIADGKRHLMIWAKRSRGSSEQETVSPIECLCFHTKEQRMTDLCEIAGIFLRW